MIRFRKFYLRRGFTLLEILVVLIIVAVMSSIAVLNTGRASYSGFMADATKVATMLELLSDEATYTNSIISCKVVSTGALSCQRYRNGEWSPLNLSKIGFWGWPNKISITKVYVNGVLLKEDERISFYYFGQTSTMSFEITDGKHTTWIDSDLYGNFAVSN